jgi:hypothetical protein
MHKQAQSSHLSREAELKAQEDFIAQGRMTRITYAETVAAIEREISKIRNGEIKLPYWVNYL